jgi:hypothetical protein
MRQITLAIFVSVLTAVYWWIVFTIVYANVLFVGDRNPALQPAPDKEILTRAVVAIVVGVILYALLIVIWQRVTRTGRRAAS